VKLTPDKDRALCILLAEDESELRQLLVEVLRNNGYNVVSAGNGEAALTAARKHRGVIDLLITDVEMPTLDGFDLQERLRRERPETKLLVISGALPRNIRGADFPLLRKPFLPADLCAKVREILGESD
jgi:two-component system cell cycle sensor histidine kinase/response regulator CckA